MPQEAHLVSGIVLKVRKERSITRCIDPEDTDLLKSGINVGEMSCVAPFSFRSLLLQ